MIDSVEHVTWDGSQSYQRFDIVKSGCEDRNRGQENVQRVDFKQLNLEYLAERTKDVCKSTLERQDGKPFWA